MAELNELDDAALEAMMQRAVNGQPMVDAEPEPEPTPEAPEPEASPEPEPEPASEPEPETPEEDLEKQQLKAVIEELESRQKLMDSKIGRFAGEADYWRKKAEATRSEPPPQSEPAYEAEPDVQERVAPSPQRRDGVTAWAVNQAVEHGVNTFERDHPESQELQAEIVDYVKSAGYDFSRLKEADDPISAQREAYRVLDEAFWHAKANRAAQTRANIEQRRTEQFSRQKEAKQRASVSGGGATSTPAPSSKTLNDLTDAELDAEMRRLTVR